MEEEGNNLHRSCCYEDLGIQSVWKHEYLIVISIQIVHLQVCLEFLQPISPEQRYLDAKECSHPVAFCLPFEATRLSSFSGKLQQDADSRYMNDTAESIVTNYTSYAQGSA
ncbi:hypothetical protein Nepgr_017231 [Nepenthes gracilis]|uniref:Uncharacterized protein n=1 Tax=Nepenthes gracilis TaxID=150966 RepID=A0AAD3XT72_NEPGR|nr:hypothetical protein Nepgr_017231 [Nepenthes gracilis]